MSPRYSRQARLAEIGVDGQARLAGAEVSVVSPGLAGDIEARYLTRAGVGTVRVDGDRTREPFLSFGILDPAARDFAQGAHAALRAVGAIVLQGGS